MPRRTTTRLVAAEESAERVATEWLRNGEIARAATGRIDDGDLASFAPVVAPSRVDILDLFSAGPRVAFHASFHGRYLGGLPQADEHRGAEARLDATGILTVSGSEVRDVRIVTDRLGTWSRLTGKAMF